MNKFNIDIFWVTILVSKTQLSLQYVYIYLYNLCLTYEIVLISLFKIFK